MKALLTLLRPFAWTFRLVMALVILFEEWGWPQLARAMAWLAKLPILKQLEALLRRLPPYGALMALLVPSLFLLPVKLFALWLLAEGYTTTGVLVVMGAKLGGTAVLAWLFQLIQPALMTLPWFAALYGRWLAWKDDLLAWIRASTAWRVARGVKRQTRLVVRAIRSALQRAD